MVEQNTNLKHAKEQEIHSLTFKIKKIDQEKHMLLDENVLLKKMKEMIYTISNDDDELSDNDDEIEVKKGLITLHGQQIHSYKKEYDEIYHKYQQLHDKYQKASHKIHSLTTQHHQDLKDKHKIEENMIHQIHNQEILCQKLLDSAIYWRTYSRNIQMKQNQSMKQFLHKHQVDHIQHYNSINAFF